MYSKQINKYLHFKRLVSRAVSVLCVWIPHLGLLYQKCDAFHPHRIHVRLRLHPIAIRDERSSDSICHVIMGCQHNLPGEGELHFHGDAPGRCSALSSDIWQWGGGLKPHSGVIPSPSVPHPTPSLHQGNSFFSPFQQSSGVRRLLNYTIIPLLRLLVLHVLIDGTFCSYRSSSSRAPVHQRVHAGPTAFGSGC